MTEKNYSNNGSLTKAKLLEIAIVILICSTGMYGPFRFDIPQNTQTITLLEKTGEVELNEFTFTGSGSCVSTRIITLKLTVSGKATSISFKDYDLPKNFIINNTPVNIYSVDEDDLTVTFYDGTFNVEYYSIYTLLTTKLKVSAVGVG